MDVNEFVSQSDVGEIIERTTGCNLHSLRQDDGYPEITGAYLSLVCAVHELGRKHSVEFAQVWADVTSDLADMDGVLSSLSRHRQTYALENENFRVDSTGWAEIRLEDGTRVKINPEGDVTELVEGEFAGEQHFTWDAAVRETAKAGKRMPTVGEWADIMRSVDPSIDLNGGWQDDVSVRAALGLKLAGYRSYPSGDYANQGTFGYYWSSSSSGQFVYLVGLSSTQVSPANNAYCGFGRSVRCLAN